MSAETEVGQEKYKPFDRMSKADKLAHAKEDFRRSISADSRFQQQARLSFQFYAGDQYTSEERNELRKAGRPDLTCNLVKPVIELIKGVNEQNRMSVKADAAEQNDAFLADVLNDCYGMVKQIEDIESAEDDALENAAICGRGFLAVDVAPDPKRPGEIKIPVVSILPSEIRLDPAGRKDDLSDHRFIFWHKWVTLEDFAIQYPNLANEIGDILAGESRGDLLDFTHDEVNLFEEFGDLPIDTPDDEDYTRVLDTGFYDRAQGHIRVVHMEYWCTYDRYYGLNPQSGQLEEFDPEQLKTLQQVIPDFQYEKVKDKKVKWYQFTGHKVLYDGDSPIPFDGFSICAEFAYKDKSTDAISHFGIVKDMIDPQREANKRWSQTLNLYIKQSQGGYLIEQDAILDEQHWKDSINMPGEDTVVANGAISDGKVQAKQMPQLPTGALQMHEVAKDLIKQVSGINPDLLGQSDSKSQPGIVIRLRQQQGMVLLAKLFKNHHRMQEQLAKRVFVIIMKYMPDAQIMRILGDNSDYIFRGELIADQKRGVVAPIRNLRDLKYNINTEETPSNMTRTMAQLSIFMEMMSKGFPVDPKTVIKHLDLPESEKFDWMQFIEQQQQQQAEAAQMQMQMEQQKVMGQLQLQGQKLQLDGQKVTQDNQLKSADIQAQRQIDMMRLGQKEQDDYRDFTVAMAQLDIDQQKLVMDMMKGLMGAGQTAAGPQRRLM